MDTARTNPRGRAVDEHDSRENVKAACVKAERSRRYDNNECFVGGKQGHKQWDCPKSQQGKAGKRVHGQAHDQTPVQQQQSPSCDTSFVARTLRCYVGPCRETHMHARSLGRSGFVQEQGWCERSYHFNVIDCGRVRQSRALTAAQ